jgi:TPR repeat protein
MAATDLGSALAVGAFGLSKDLAEAERYLRIGIAGGDVSAQRNLGLMLLDIEGRLEDAVHEPTLP